MNTTLLILSMFLTSQHSTNNATVDAGTYALQIGVGTAGAVAGGIAAMVPFQATLFIMAASDVDIDPAENRLALGLMLTGVAAAGAGYCLGAAYTTRWIGDARGYDGSWNRDLVYSFAGGAAWGALTAGALLLRKKTGMLTLPMAMLVTGLLCPSIGGTIGYNSQAIKQPAISAAPPIAPQRGFKVPLVRIGLD